MHNLLFVNIGSFEIVVIIAALIALLYLLVAVFQILNRETGVTKVLWILIVLFFPYLGATIYFLSRYLDSKKRKENARRDREVQ
ncbi:MULTISPECIES: PLDc N-terminal domain-containing protein [Sphingobacterium]|uniref:PLDc N-terminal domain-containing protein n=1 Tax=Sphingobacterium populi TaxID=1812824 RepID=A0ABW5U9Y8_9SPHI|nr:PLD nuclease N-terminal domain-containing protein [Sphingobacterium sp. CFCC 11742]